MLLLLLLLHTVPVGGARCYKRKLGSDPGALGRRLWWSTWCKGSRKAASDALFMSFLLFLHSSHPPSRPPPKVSPKVPAEMRFCVDAGETRHVVLVDIQNIHTWHNKQDTRRDAPFSSTPYFIHSTLSIVAIVCLTREHQRRRRRL